MSEKFFKSFRLAGVCLIGLRELPNKDWFKMMETKMLMMVTMMLTCSC